MNTLLELFFTFASLALMSVGGAATILPEMERQVVTHGWMTHQAFVEGFAISQLVPGPNMLLVFFIGYRVASWAGALAAGLGMFGPPCLLLTGIAWLTQNPRSLTWVKRFHAAIEPISIGLIAAATWILGQDLVGNPFLVAVGSCAAICTIRKWLSPIWLMGLAIVIGLIKATVLNPVGLNHG